MKAERALAKRGIRRYVFDTSTFHTLKHYYLPTFAPVWELLDLLVSQDGLLSVEEVLAELNIGNGSQQVAEWVSRNESIFLPPSALEMEFLRDMFEEHPHFQQLVDNRKILNGQPAADPLVIAAGHYHQACVVSQEGRKPHSAKIPTVCDKLDIECIDLAAFFEREGLILVSKKKQ